MALEEYIRSNLSYDPETGLLTWLTKGTFNRVPGAVAGGINYNPACGKAYWRVKVRGKAFGAHVVAWFLQTGQWPAGLLDHIDGDGTNNKWGNLREATPEQNQRNRRLNGNNKSGVSGVIRRSSGQWEVQIKGEGRLLYLGRYSSFEAAVAVRRAAEVKYGYHQNHGRQRPLYGGDNE